jgi:hypothetical protein
VRLVAVVGIVILELTAIANHIDGAALAAAVGAIGVIGGYQHHKDQVAAQVAAAKKAS